MNNNKFKYYECDLEYIMEHPHNEWDYQKISWLNNLDFEFVKKYPNKDWDYYYLSHFIKTKDDLEFVKKYPHKDWCYHFISFLIKTKDDLEFVKKYPYKDWTMDLIEKNDFFYYDLIEIFDNSKWSFKVFSEYIKIKKCKKKHKRNYKEVLDEFLAVVFHPDNAERLGLWNNNGNLIFFV